jgi:hypothetical protein
VIEPMPSSLPRFDRSLLTQLMPNVEIVDVNDVATFPDAAFYDGWHLHQPDWADYYQTLLSSQGLMQFARQLPLPTLPLWHGETISFASTARDGPARLTNMQAAEPWGRWTNGTHGEILVRVDPSAMRSRTLVLEATALARKGPQTVRLMLDDKLLCERELTTTGDVTIACPLPSEIRDFLELTVETSYATSPQEFGEPDARDLGIGLRKLTLK